MNKRIPVYESEKKIEEMKAVMEYEALVKDLTESFNKVIQEHEEMMQEARMYGRNGHPAEE